MLCANVNIVIKALGAAKSKGIQRKCCPQLSPGCLSRWAELESPQD